MVIETWQSTLMYDFVGFFEVRPCKKLGKIQKVVMCVHRTNQ